MIANYKAPTLTATGGGIAATGDVGDLAQTGPAPTSRRAVVTQAAASGASGGSAATATGAAAGASGAAASAGSGSAAAASGAGRSGSGAAASAGAAASGAAAAAGTAKAGTSATGAAPLVVVSRGASEQLLAPATGFIAVLGGVLALL